MVHLIESIAYTGDAPWHGLGNQLSENQPIEVWADQAGMNWEILKAQASFNIKTSEKEIQPLKSFPERKVLYRSDNNHPLSIVSDRYKIVQPKEILEFYRDLTEQAGFELETAGVLKEGKKLWALARTGQSSTLKGSDTTNAYVLLATACDGSMATTAQFTSIRVVCNNTLSVALGDDRHTVKVSHSTTFNAKSVKHQLGISASSWDEFMYSMKILSERKVTDKEAQRFMDRVFNPQGHENINSKAISQVICLFDGQGRGSRLSSAKGTAYGLLNSVTEFVDHERRSKSSDHRLDSAWFGQGANIKARALNKALQMIA